MDIVGEIYEKWSYPNAWAGQFFTPMTLCTAMSGILDVKSTADERTKEALAADPIASIWLFCEKMMVSALPDVQGFTSKVPQIVSHMMTSGAIKPVTVLDPCCGSGRMFLGVMRNLPS